MENGRLRASADAVTGGLRTADAAACDPAHGHICLYVDDLDATYARLEALGYTSRAGEVVTIPEGPLAGSKAVYMIDPDGFHVELYESVSAS